jgi:NAD-dependent deacetylase
VVAKDKVLRAAELLRSSSHTTAFTGAGVSVESGIPTFRGKGGLWEKINPVFLDTRYFGEHPGQSWKLIKSLFYDSFGKAEPNQAHQALAALEGEKLLDAIVTQNIDDLHRRAGSRVVIEFHGTLRVLVCTACGKRYDASEELLSVLPPRCMDCANVLKPDFVFFGEPIPEPARTRSFHEAEIADVFLLIGTTGEIQPASMIPVVADKNDATIIEINIAKSNYTGTITDVFLEGRATEVMTRLLDAALG